MNSEFRLLVADESSGASGLEGRFSAIPIPQGLSWLSVPHRDAGLPEIGDRLPEISGERPPSEDALCLEPLILLGRREHVLAAGEDLQVNGRSAQPLAVLSTEDEIRVGGATLHLTLYRKPHVAVPPAEQAGGLCPVCRTPVTAESRAYFCACGQLLHQEGDEVSADTRLQCAQAVETCPDCRRKVRLTGGYDSIPGD